MSLKSLLLALTTSASLALSAQTYQFTHYIEGTDSIVVDKKSWVGIDRLRLSWAAPDFRFVKHQAPGFPLCADTSLTAWQGENLLLQAVAIVPKTLGKVRLEVKQTQGVTTTATAKFLRYVLTDDFAACGKNPRSMPPYLVADIIDSPTLYLEGETVRPFVVSVEAPRNSVAQDIRLEVKLVNDFTNQTLSTLHATVKLAARQLPAPKDYGMHIDFWQQPYAVSRAYNVPRWSKAHFEKLRPYMQLLARSGQKVASAFLFYEPWGIQSQDKFTPLIRTTKCKDGLWLYDYTDFDKWINFLASCGIDAQINCYSMVPWDMTFRYYDEALGRNVDLKTTTSSPEYKALWTPFLKAFAAHLKEKGWFEKTCIAMDERGLPNMLDAYKIVQEAAPGMKIALAGNYHKELVDKLYDYSLAYGQHFSKEELAMRRAKGGKSTMYTCCAHNHPGFFTASLPTEPAYLALYCAANDFDGYLHWSWMNWSTHPLTDSRYFLFQPGDTYIIYPGKRSSLRWEHFLDGLQQAEKLRLLKEDYEKMGNAEGLATLNDALSAFKAEAVVPEAIAEKIAKLKQLLNAL